jgi:nucleoside-diphosphate-sugar epimerase
MPTKYGSSMLILVTGGAGKMGLRLVTELVGRGDSVRVLCLPGDPSVLALSNLKVEVVFGDVTRKESLLVPVRGVTTIFHLAAVLDDHGQASILTSVNAEGTRNLVAVALAASVQHFIYISSISVLYPMTNNYAISKRMGEDWVRTSGLKNFTILRPSLAYAEGGAEEFNRFVTHIQRGPFVALPGGGRALKSPVHIDDLVSAFLVIPLNPVTFGKTYHLTGGGGLSLREMAELLLEHMGKSKVIIPIPKWLCRLTVIGLAMACRLTKIRNPFTWQIYSGLVQDALAPDRLTQTDLDYHPRTFFEGLATLKSLRNP